MRPKAKHRIIKGILLGVALSVLGGCTFYADPYGYGSVTIGYADPYPYYGPAWGYPGWGPGWGYRGYYRPYGYGYRHYDYDHGHDYRR